jgi:alpha-beta hydrolase superfamily lysophospholipase
VEARYLLEQGSEADRRQDQETEAMILDDPMIGGRIFYPRRTQLEPNLVVDVGGAQLGCYRYEPCPGAGTVLYFHGNGELAAEYATHFVEVFRVLGTNVCFAEYRGYGKSTGAPALVAMLGDGEKIVHALGVPPERLVALGRSLGSLYAIELAHRLPSLAGLIIESGIADVQDLWIFQSELARSGAVEAEVAREVDAYLNQRKKLEDYRGPLLVLHAADDGLLDRTHAERLYVWGGGSDKKLVVFPHGDHNSVFFANAQEYLREVGEFLRRTGITLRGGKD